MIVKRIVFGKNSYYVLLTYLYIFLIELQLNSPIFDVLCREVIIKTSILLTPIANHIAHR